MTRIVENTAVSEAGLIVRARAGDITAFSMLVRMHEEKAVRMAYSFTRHWEDARDMAQEAFVKAYENLGKFRGESLFSTWLYRIIANLCKDSFRKKKVRQGINISLLQKTDDEPAEDPVNRVVSRAPGALDQMMSQELGETIFTCAGTLPEQQKNVFSLRYFQGLSLEEIAETLDLSTGTVKAHLWQAGQKMKKLLSVKEGYHE